MFESNALFCQSALQLVDASDAKLQLFYHSSVFDGKIRRKTAHAL